MGGVGPENLNLDLESDPSTTSFGDDGDSTPLKYVSEDSGTSFSSDRVEHASDAEWASVNSAMHEGKNRVFKVLSNVLERDAPLDFSISLSSMGGNSSSHLKLKGDLGTTPAITFTPLGDIPEAPAAPTSVAEAFATAQFHKARHLFSVGMAVDPQHGPLYHAYGNMELVNAHNIPISDLIADISHYQIFRIFFISKISMKFLLIASW